MDKMISDYIKNCEICNKAKYDRLPPIANLNLTPTASKPLDHIFVDTFEIEKLKFVTILDYFTKYAIAYEIKTKNATETCDAFLDYFMHYGIPRKITTDNGTEFDNGLIKDLIKLYEIEHHLTTPNNPRSNGAVERFHSTLIEHYRVSKLASPNLKPIVRVKQCVISYNNTIHSATNFTPQELLLGQTNAANPYSINVQHRNYEIFIDELKKTTQAQYELVKQNLIRTKEAAYQGNLRKNQDSTQQYRVGDKVYMRNTHGRSKVTNPFIGPYVIQEINPNKTCVLINSQTKHTRRIHMDKLKHSYLIPDTESDDSSVED